MNYLKYLVGVLVLAAIVGGYYYPHFTQLVSGTSTAGNTYTTAKQASVVVNLANPGANATSSSVLNSDAYDRYVTALKVGCQGVGTSGGPLGLGVATLTLKVATTSTAAPAAFTNTNLVGSGVVTISTSTPYFVEASSTALTAVPNTGVTVVNNVWLAGSYMTFFTNATNTAACTFGVDYFGS